MRINHKLLRYTCIELAIPAWRIVQADHMYADDFGNVDAPALPKLFILKNTAANIFNEISKIFFQ